MVILNRVMSVKAIEWHFYVSSRVRIYAYFSIKRPTISRKVLDNSYKKYYTYRCYNLIHG